MLSTMAPIHTLHKYDLDINIQGILNFNLEGIEAENKQQASIKFYEMLPENMKEWTPNILECYIERTIWL